MPGLDTQEHQRKEWIREDRTVYWTGEGQSCPGRCRETRAVCRRSGWLGWFVQSSSRTCKYKWCRDSSVIALARLTQAGKPQIVVQSCAGISCCRDICSGMEPLGCSSSSSAPPHLAHLSPYPRISHPEQARQEHSPYTWTTEGPNPAALGDHTVLPTMCCPCSL